MEIYVVTTKKGRIIEEYGVWDDPDDAFRNVCEMNIHASVELRKINVQEYDLKKMKKGKTFIGSESVYCYKR